MDVKRSWMVQEGMRTDFDQEDGRRVDGGFDIAAAAAAVAGGNV